MGICCASSSKNMVEIQALTIPGSTYPKNSARGSTQDLETKRTKGFYRKDILKYYSVHETIGTGQFGVVRKASLWLNPDYQFAIKTLNKVQFQKSYKNLKREIEIITQIDHPNIIKPYRVFEDGKHLHIVTELCTGGELHEKVQ